jgi:predicted transcriptional regulator
LAVVLVLQAFDVHRHHAGLFLFDVNELDHALVDEILKAYLASFYLPYLLTSDFKLVILNHEQRSHYPSFVCKNSNLSIFNVSDQ